MTIEEMKRLIALLALLALAGCGVELSDGVGGPGIAVKVKRAASFNPGIEHGRIESYRVIVTGEGIEEPIIAEFAGDAEEGIVAGVPAGRDRTVSVEAVNPNEIVIREGETGGVEVGGGLTEAVVEMEAVPIFTNVASGSTVDNTRLVFKIFSDPANPVAVREYAHGGESALVDASTSLPQVYLDMSTGLGRFSPALMEPGRRRFAAVDAVTGRSHVVDVTVVDGRGRRAAPAVTASSASEHGSGCSAPWCAPK